MDAYIELLKRYEVVQKNKLKNKKRDRREQESFFILLAMVSISILLAILYWALGRKYEILVIVSEVILLLSYIYLMVLPVIALYNMRENIILFFTKPISASIENNIRKESSVDELFLPKLIRLKREMLELGLMVLRSERSALAKRITIVAGPIDKIGILPGIISMLVTISKPETGQGWVACLAYAYIGLTIISMYFIDLKIKYDRLIALTELALKNKQDN